MISRIATVAALLAGAALWTAPVQAQTGTSAQGAVNSGGASATGSVGTTSNTPRNNSSSSSTTMGPSGGGMTNSPGPSDPMNRQGTVGAQGNTNASSNMDGTNLNAGGRVSAQAQAGPRQGRTMRGDRGERQMTECLNNAAAQRTSFDSCRR